jgi:hypothetical protein
MPGRLVFSTTADGASSPTERLRITSAGRVGIGTTSPGHNLEIKGSFPDFAISDSDTANDKFRILYNSGSTQLQVDPNNVSSGSHLLVSVDNTERARIDSSGRLGIGTSTPDGLLHVASASAGTVTANGNANELVVENSSTGGISILTPDANHGYLIFGSPSDNEGAIIRYRHSDGIYTIGTEAAGGSIQLRSGSGTTALTIDSSQRVGIGTTGPAAALHVVAGGTAAYFISNASSAGVSIGSDTNLGKIGTNGSTCNLAFNIDAAEKARIDTSGRFLVGTSSSSADAKFIVQGGATASGGAVNIQRNATTASAGSTIGYISFTNSANNVGATISADGDGTWSAGTSHPTRLGFFTTAAGASTPTERLRINNNGRLSLYSADGAASIFTTTEAAGTSDSLIVGKNAGSAINTGTDCFVVRSNGNVENTNNSYGSISDAKLKENIVDAGPQWSDIKGRGR